MTSDTLTSNDAALTDALARAAPSPTRRWLTLLALLLVGAVTVLVVRSRLQTNVAPITFVAAPVTRGALTSNITATGTLRARGLVRLGAETNGRVTKVAADFNQPVARDQVLAELDATQAEASLRQAQAQLAAVRADVANRSATAAEANQSLARTRQLVSRSMASAQQLDADTANAARAEASVAAARAQLLVSEAGVALAKATVDKTRIRSPLDGVVLSRDLEVGQTVNAPSQLFTVAQPLTTLEALISIDEEEEVEQS
jgi:HlyD family secretion protein